MRQGSRAGLIAGLMARVEEPGASATLAATLLAADPAGVGGAVIIGARGPAADSWLTGLGVLLDSRPLVRVPLGVTEDRLLGGLDLTATLSARRPVAERGLLARADTGLIVMSMAERAAAPIVGALLNAMDRSEVLLERETLSIRYPTSFGVVAFDESTLEEVGVADGLLDRVAFRIRLPRHPEELGPWPAPGWLRGTAIAAVAPAADGAGALCEAAAALGVSSLRGAVLALRVARLLAQLEGASRIEDRHLIVAAQLVLSPRATIGRHAAPAPRPASDQQRQSAEEAPSSPPLAMTPDEAGKPGAPEGEAAGELAERVVAAAQAAIPADMLETGPGRAGGGAATAGRGAGEREGQRGRQVGSRPGDPRRGGRLDLLATLRAAAPWQTLRDPERNSGDPLRIMPQDFRLRVLRRKAGRTVIFVVDASGSSALGRLAEAKGAVEQLLAEGYARRDWVALISFRGSRAETLLPPTRSLTRAKRLLGELAGGGGTPLAAGLDVGCEVARQVSRDGSEALLVILTDGRANVARDARADRPAAEADALAAARSIGLAGVPSVVVDTAPRPAPFARKLAAAMGGVSIRLPSVDSSGIREIVNENSRRATGGRG